MRKNMMCEQEVKSPILDHLISIGCCWRCAERYLGKRDSIQYSKKEISHSHTEPPMKQKRSNPCISCLGILQDDYCKDIIDKVCEKIEAEEFDARSFACTLSIPICLQIRAHSLWLHLMEKFGDEYKNHDQDDVVPSIKEVWRWSYGQGISSRIHKALEKTDSDLFVMLNFVYSQDEEECSELVKIFPNMLAERRRDMKKFHGEMFTRSSVAKSLESSVEGKFREHCSCPPTVPDVPVSWKEIQCVHASLFIAGRYLKLSRDLSQTPWIVDGKRLKENSVQELISDPLMELIRCEDTKFLAAGREDVDVRMLGQGRPFVLEFINPHRVLWKQSQLREMSDSINTATSDIQVRDLQVVARDDVTNLKAGETQKTKCYTALCYSSKSISELDLSLLGKVKDLVLYQKTPIRVLHRRSLAPREKIIHEISAEPVDRNRLKLHVKTQAGTYIKEFVHGDFGRTFPNLGSILGGQFDILALDVTAVNLPWPEFLDD